MGSVPHKEDVLLEYRVAVLEALTDWMLTNGVFNRAMETSEMADIHEQAVAVVRRRYPGAHVEFKGRWPR